MTEFQDQLKNSRERDKKEFLTSPKFAEIRTLYRGNFEKITELIRRYGRRQAIEDIANLAETTFRPSIYENLLFLQEINGAIRDQDLTLDDF